MKSLTPFAPGLLLVALIGLGAACRPAPQPPSPLSRPAASGPALAPAAPQSVEEMEALLREAGLAIQFDSELPTDYLPGQARIYSLDKDQERVEIYAYATAAEAAQAAAGISPDGLTMADPRAPGERVMVQWSAPPHAYLSGRFLLIYAGAEEPALAALAAALGPPFAGDR